MVLSSVTIQSSFHIQTMADSEFLGVYILSIMLFGLQEWNSRTDIIVLINVILEYFLFLYFYI